MMVKLVLQNNNYWIEYMEVNKQKIHNNSSYKLKKKTKEKKLIIKQKMLSKHMNNLNNNSLHIKNQMINRIMKLI